MKTILYIFLASILFFSCEKDATNIKLPKATPKLVIGCFLSPEDNTIHTSVTGSSPIFGQNNSTYHVNTIANASVTLSDGTNTVPFVYDAINYTYKINALLFPIVPGKTYTIFASSSGYNSVSGNCIVPTSITNSASATIASSDYGSKKLRIKWNDIPSEKNYYRVLVKYVAVNDNNISDTIIDKDNDYSKSTYTDNGNDGNELFTEIDNFIAIGSKYYNYSYTQDPYTVKAYQIEIFNLDVNYFKYQYSLDNYSSGDPFSEVSFIYTNIDKGLGVIGASRPYKFRVN